MDLKAALQLLRPVNCLMIGFAVIVGEVVSKPPGVSAVESALGFATGFLICAYSMTVNDIYDVDVDRVNQPGRPIPSGRLSLGEANRLSALLLAGGVAASVLSLNLWAVVVAVAYAGLSWLYNSRLKRAGLSGNAVVASSLAIPFLYGGVISGGSISSSLLLLMAGTAFFAGVGREVVKAMADTQGDEKRSVRSVARVRGMRVASAVGAGFFLLAIVTSWVPLVTANANQFYAYGVLVPDVVFLYLAVSVLRVPTAENSHRVKKIALLGMLVGLVVFVGGGF